MNPGILALGDEAAQVGMPGGIGQQVAFPDEPGQVPGLQGHRRGQHLHGHQQARILGRTGQVHRGHAAAGDGREQHVRPEPQAARDAHHELARLEAGDHPVLDKVVGQSLGVAVQEPGHALQGRLEFVAVHESAFDDACEETLGMHHARTGGIAGGASGAGALFRPAIDQGLTPFGIAGRTGAPDSPAAARF